MMGEYHILPNSTGGVTFTTAVAGIWVNLPASTISVEASLSAAGGTATVEVHGSNLSTTTASAATLLATVTLSGANDRATITKSEAAYVYKKAVVTAIGGSAVVSVGLGV